MSMSALQTKIDKAISSLKLAAKMSLQYYGKPLIVTYSGGKDSDVMLDISCKCLKPDEFEVLNSHTTVDAPQTVYHIRNKFKELNRGGYQNANTPTDIQGRAYNDVDTHSTKVITTDPDRQILLLRPERSIDTEQSCRSRSETSRK